VLAAKHFGALFNDRTFANLHKPPYLLIGATDISRGQEFIFSETQFRCIHSDLGQYPLGYAVAASAAFPVYFGSIPLKNFNTYGSPDEREYETLRGRVKGPIVPLLDGGLVDNLAVRAYLDPLANGMLIGGTSAPGRPPARALIFIQADGSAHLEEELDDTRRSPNIITRTRRSFDVTFEQQIRDIERELELALWKLDEVHALRRDFQFVYLPARLRDVKQETLRHVPTAWSLTEAQVNGLIEAGKQAITNESRKVGRIQNLFKTSSP
jgi:predicted acylesterase/phospholipase RssA